MSEVLLRELEVDNRIRQGRRTGVLLRNEPLAPYTSWRVGGPADRLYLPTDAEDLAGFLARLPESEPVFWLGLGSNLLVRDGGIRGTVICTKNRLKQMQAPSAHHVYAEAGVACAQVARFSAERALVGAEFLAGIPGTVGGALAMNAGAFGGETWDIVKRIKTLDRHGQIRWREPAEFAIAYRSIHGLSDDEWFLAGEFALTDGDSDLARQRIRDLLARRSATQPTHYPSCGSTFRNPPGDHAGRLIESCGLKGHRLGGAEVSEKHANFILNRQGATAADIERLVRYVRTVVFERTGVDLATEVRIVGEPAALGGGDHD